MNENLELKSINKILDKDFYIPSYQRGYRWESRQVEDLLEDILEFSQNKKIENEFYCLQPIVVLPEEQKEHIRYRVIDGQQRLTTLYIILKYLENLLEEEHGIFDIYKIFYETRNEKGKSSQEFLENIDNSIDQQLDNIDFYYMNNTYNVVKKWFNSVIREKKITKRKFLEVLMGSDNKDIKIIWYEINSKEKEIDVFTRLNIGKIPLTNAELIKALFLINLNKENESDKILLASQWDEIEYKLQEDDFFAFINVGNFDKATKIEYIFDLIADAKNIKIENLYKGDDKYSFYIFNELIKGEMDSKEIWDEVKTYFRIFNELYVNNTYYHLVGFIIQTGGSIKSIVNKFLENEKDKFEYELKKLIKNGINFDGKVLKANNNEDKELEYGNNKDQKVISKILFLFNVISTMESGYSRYPFDKHFDIDKNEKWSLEHIHAQNSENITSDTDRRLLLEDELKYVPKKLQNKIHLLLKEEEIADEDFMNLQDEIFLEYSDNINLHTIDNLALLGKDANSALNNSIFPSKRDKIKNLDRLGSFIPIGTKNVFLKYYSSDVKEAISWNKEDRQAYLTSITTTLKNYIGEK